MSSWWDMFLVDNMLDNDDRNAFVNDFEDEINKLRSPEGITNTDDATGIGGTNDDAILLNLEPSTLELDLVLEPVSEPKEISPTPVTSQPTRQPRKRIPREHWGESAKPVAEQHRPGRTPKKRDHEVSQDELKRRNRRREQNKQAAQRQREKRNNKVKGLEEKVEQLTSDNQTLLTENQRLKVELETLRNQQQYNQQQYHQQQYHQQQENTAQQMFSSNDDLQPTQYDSQHENYAANVL